MGNETKPSYRPRKPSDTSRENDRRRVHVSITVAPAAWRQLTREAEVHSLTYGRTVDLLLQGRASDWGGERRRKPLADIGGATGKRRMNTSMTLHPLTYRTLEALTRLWGVSKGEALDRILNPRPCPWRKVDLTTDTEPVY